MVHVMYDSINAGDFPPSGFDATAGYVAGRYPSSAPILQRFPNVPHLTIAVSASQDADCLDVEPGDATPDQAPAWFDRRPGNRVIYCMASMAAQVKAMMGDRNYLLWSAHYNGRPHVCSPSECGYPAADATQWADKGPNGENVDQSLLSDKFYTTITGAGEDDMPSSEEVAAAVWGHQISKGDMAAAAWQWLADARIITAWANDHAGNTDKRTADVDSVIRETFNRSDWNHTDLTQLKADVADIKAAVEALKK